MNEAVLAGDSSSELVVIEIVSLSESLSVMKKGSSWIIVMACRVQEQPASIADYLHVLAIASIMS
jgi:hypothetical protein